MLIYRIISACFIIFWIAFILMDYWEKHIIYAYNFLYFQYYDLLGMMAVLGAGVTFGVLQLKNLKKPPRWLNGLTMFGLVLFSITISVQFYLTKTNFDVGDGSFLNLLLMFISTSAATYSILLVAYVIGELIWMLFPIPIKGLTKDLILIALGFLGMIALLFIVGLFGLIVWYVVAPLFLIILGLRYKSALDFLKRSLIKSVGVPKNINTLGILSFYLLIITISWTSLQVNLPFPRGWDALSLYAALPSLINDYNGLVSGFQPYNWSLVMSLGLVLFGKIEVLLMLSYMGCLLSLFALFDLSRNVFKMDVNFSLLAVMIFNLLPTIGFQSIHDQKVDLSLLFIMLSIVMIFINWIQHNFNKEEKEKITTTALINPHMALMGLLTGLAFGIKLTTLFIFFSVLAAIWYALKGQLGFIAVFTVSIFGILLLKLDEQSGLRVYHLGASTIQWIMLVAGLVLTALLFQKNRIEFLRGIRLSVVFGLFFLLPVIPWLGKNFAETKTLDTKSLLTGKSNAPSPRIRDFTKRHQQYKQNKK